VGRSKQGSIHEERVRRWGRELKDCSQWTNTVASWQVFLLVDCISGVMLLRFLEGAEERLP
jgi:hypothetical protein